MRFAKFVCSLRIRVENREMPVAAPSMQDRQPSLILRIEALGSDLAQRAGRCLGEPPQSTSSRRPIGGLPVLLEAGCFGRRHSKRSA